MVLAWSWMRAIVTADEYTTPAPPDVAWEADESCLRWLTVGVQVLRDLSHAVGVRE